MFRDCLTLPFRSLEGAKESDCLKEFVVKLFPALESNPGDVLEDNKLLIDKVIEYSEIKDSDLSVTADLIKRRDELKKSIVKDLENGAKKEEEEADSSGDSEAGSSDEGSAPQTDVDESPKDEGNDKKDSASTTDPEDESAAADNEGDLEGVIGSGLGDGESKKDEDKGSESSKPAAESFQEKTPTKAPSNKFLKLNAVFKPIRDKFNAAQIALESFGLKKKEDPSNQPVAYMEQEVVESLEYLLRIAQSYIAKNDTLTVGSRDGLKRLLEELTVFEEYFKNGNIHFTHAVVDDKDILGMISTPGKSAPRDTVTVLTKFTEASSSLVSKILTNGFNQLESDFLTSGFSAEDGEITYKDTLPGFQNVQASLSTFTNYIDTNYEDYQVYSIKYIRTDDLYDLPGVALTKDKDFEHLLSQTNKLIVDASVALDNLKTLNESYKKFCSDIKVIIYDIEKNKDKKLADLGLDEKLQDFIKFKLATEVYVILVEAVMSYLSGITGVLRQTVELGKAKQEE